MRQALCLQMNVPYLDLTRSADRSGAGQADQPDLCGPQRRRAGVAGRPDAHRGDERPVGSRGGRGSGAVHRLHHPGRHELAARDSGRDHPALLTRLPPPPRSRRSRASSWCTTPRTMRSARNTRRRAAAPTTSSARSSTSASAAAAATSTWSRCRATGSTSASASTASCASSTWAAAAGVQRERAVDRVAREDPRANSTSPSGAGRRTAASGCAPKDRRATCSTSTCACR